MDPISMAALSAAGINPGNNVGESEFQSRKAKAYNPKLAAKDKKFQEWYAANTLEGKNGVPYSEDQAYDYYSFFKNQADGNIEDHFPDTYKRPHHPTFSNESIYSTPRNPGGRWEGEKFIPYQGKKK